jgi:hypothetical protein
MAEFLAIPENADVTRTTYDKTKSYSRVLFQQALPLLDAELNETQDILDDKIQTLYKLFGSIFVSDAALVTQATVSVHNFNIKGGEILCQGVQGFVPVDIDYVSQSLSTTHVRKFVWDITANIPPALTTVATTRSDLVVACFVKVEVNSSADPSLIDPNLGIEAAIRWKTEVGFRVLEGYTGLVTACDASFQYYNPNGCWRVPIAWIHRTAGTTISSAMIEDIRNHVWNSEDEIFAQFDGGGNFRVPETMYAKQVLVSVGGSVVATIATTGYAQFPGVTPGTIDLGGGMTAVGVPASHLVDFAYGTTKIMRLFSDGSLSVIGTISEVASI